MITWFVSRRVQESVFCFVLPQLPFVSIEVCVHEMWLKVYFVGGAETRFIRGPEAVMAAHL